MPDLVIARSSSRIQTYVRKFNPAVNVEREGLSDCVERNALLGLLINYVIIIAPVLP
jgi:hypothetical protein